MPSSSLASPASPGPSERLLESFLHDMDALDRQQSNHPENAREKRKLDVSKAFSTAPRSPSPKQKLPSWLKRKQELETLRQQTQAMETRVVYLEMKQSSPGGGLNAFELHKLKSSALVEKQKCQEAQNENERLRAKLRLLAGQYEAFQVAVAAAAAFQQKELRGALRVERQVQGCGAQEFDMMERRVDARFHELDHAFTIMQQPMTSMDTDMIQTRNDDIGAVEFTRLELLPFARKAISATIWSFAEAGKFPDGENTIVSRRSEDSLAVSTRVTVQIECGGMVSIDTRTVMKRFVTPQGYAVMTESCSDWHVESPASGVWSHMTREGGCFVMRDYADDGGASPGICQTRSFLCLYPGENTENAQRHSRAESSSIRKVVVPSFRQLTIARHQFAENALFDTIRS
ncbi:hypothetical protein PHYPSEUDO_009317 [Phytophthora pseudosyringae]|uniref:M96 mating-specific protein family n=1 Tax=Phytophthora pseudosyringae TaxID=221518 RepID=A0A8T1VFA3_9STRA|nr:hypothetical protein PHYPSEUDO_009317 [Phytophthora pseudosyringae]